MKRIKIDKKRCKACLLCLNICPVGVLEGGREINNCGMLVVDVKYPDKCTKCGLCAMVCPDCAIIIE